MRRPIFLFVISLIMFGVLFGSVNLLMASDAKPVRKIIVFKQGMDLEQGSQKVEKLGVVISKKLHLINGVAVQVQSSKVVNMLKNQKEILRIDDDLKVHALGKPTKITVSQPPQELPWGVDRIDADLAWTASTGTGVKVAVLDTGIDLDHPDLKQNIKGGYNAINPKKSYNDDNGHGTHVAGIIGAVDNSIGVIGVAPNVDLYIVKVLDGYGNGYLSDVIEGLQWSVNNGMQIINMSLGTTSDNPSLHNAVKAVYDAGIIIVTSAGNLGPSENSVTYPAKYPETIAVSAVDNTDSFANFSSVGPEVDLAAPGVEILSTWNDGLYRPLSGTSMAAPHVTGTAALVLSVKGPMAPNELRNYLLQKAENLGLLSTQQGTGLVDAEGLTQ